MSVKFPLNEQSLFVSWAVVLRSPGQRQLDKVRCPEAAALCSKARPFAPYCASSVQLRAARPAKGSPSGVTATTAASGGNREELLGQRPAGCKRQRSRRWVPQPGRWHRAAMTERFCPAVAHGQAVLRTTSQSRRKLLASSPSRGATGESDEFTLDAESLIWRERQCLAVKVRCF